MDEQLTSTQSRTSTSDTDSTPATQWNIESRSSWSNTASRLMRGATTIRSCTPIVRSKAGSSDCHKMSDLTIRNYSPRTIEVYVDRVAKFAQHFGQSPGSRSLGQPSGRRTAGEHPIAAGRRGRSATGLSTRRDRPGVGVHDHSACPARHRRFRPGIDRFVPSTTGSAHLHVRARRRLLR